MRLSLSVNRVSQQKLNLTESFLNKLTTTSVSVELVEL